MFVPYQYLVYVVDRSPLQVLLKLINRDLHLEFMSVEKLCKVVPWEHQLIEIIEHLLILQPLYEGIKKVLLLLIQLL